MNAEFHTIEQKITFLKEHVIRLKKLKGQIKSYPDFAKDDDKQALVERLFQISLEATLDIGRMIISLENLPRPQTNKEIFHILDKADIISNLLAVKAEGLGTFRNILVHGYLLVDKKKVYENLQELHILEEFTGFILKYLKKKTSHED